MGKIKKKSPIKVSLEIEHLGNTAKIRLFYSFMWILLVFDNLCFGGPVYWFFWRKTHYKPKWIGSTKNGLCRLLDKILFVISLLLIKNPFFSWILPILKLFVYVCMHRSDFTKTYMNMLKPLQKLANLNPIFRCIYFLNERFPDIPLQDLFFLFSPK